MGGQSFSQLIQGSLDQLEVFLLDQADLLSAEIREIVRYCILSKGKRIRPALVFLSGLPQNQTLAGVPLLRFAALVELIHLATLVHDDILDGAKLRHGVEALHCRHNVGVAVLAGDVMLCHALKLATDFNSPVLCASVAAATRQVCTGEVRQSFYKLSPEIDFSAYVEIVDQKTAALFELSCRWGALLGGYTQEQSEVIAAIGSDLGLAFQGLDDILDFWGREGDLGKTLGRDAHESKLTLPVVLGLLALSPSERGYWIAQKLEKSVSLQNWRDLFDRYDILGQSCRFVERYLSQASARIQSLDGLAAGQNLEGVCHFLTEKLQSISRVQMATS